jgi:hypothetical protein
VRFETGIFPFGDGNFKFATRVIGFAIGRVDFAPNSIRALVSSAGNSQHVIYIRRQLIICQHVIAANCQHVIALAVSVRHVVDSFQASNFPLSTLIFFSVLSCNVWLPRFECEVRFVQRRRDAVKFGLVT